MEPAVALALVVGGRELCTEVAAAIGKEAKVISAQGIDAAVRLAARQPPALVLFDELILGSRPLEVVESIRTFAPGMRVVVITGSTDRDRVASFTAVGTVVKHPIDPERLRATVKNALRLAAMATGVNRMRQTGNFAAITKELLDSAIDAQTPPKNER
jgi:DNA-binding NtrC family response regulator